jgi:ABC-type transporter Mla subunit MlaD
MTRRTADTLLGLLVVTVVGLLVFVLSRTQGWAQRRMDLYMVTESAQDLTVDTKVYLQGLEVGRLQSLAPLVDPSMGRPRFLATLRLRRAYANGAPLILPAGTRAEIRAATGLTGGAYIALEIPTLPASVAALQPGDTIVSLRRPGALESLSQVADSLKDQVKDVLENTQHLLERLNRAADLATSQLDQTAPEIRRTLQEAQATLAQLRPTLTQVSRVLEHTDERLGPLQDSLTTTLGAAHGLLGRLDSLSFTAHNLVLANQDDIRQTVNNLLVLSAQMDHFMDQVSRKPLKMFSGVRPLPPESLPPSKPRP